MLQEIFMSFNSLVTSVSKVAFFRVMFTLHLCGLLSVSSEKKSATAVYEQLASLHSRS